MGDRHLEKILIGISRRALLSVALAATGSALFATSSPAAVPPPAAALTAQDIADLRRIAAYLNGIHTMAARFRQTSSDGSSATGSLWMARPGRMRFEYDPPSPILLIADQFYVYYVDKQLAQMSKVGLKSTPAWFLLRDPITFDDLVVTRFERGANSLRVAVIAPADPDKGSLTMVFNNEPLALRQWTIVDQQRRSTTVSIYDAQFGIALDPGLFVYRDPYGHEY
ncbi:MAG: outer membrane lipoprotein carrier protein LolA [Alphaproteobacteria bacterium]|nr:outer membrane lipoprotein carrier protein LolA [Alphaproteobacteria bacterium]